MKKNTKNKLLKLTYSAMFLALALVLPFLTGNNRELGNMLCLMHIPVLLCGFTCGWPYGLAVGFVAPLLRHFTLSAPPTLAIAIPMAFELAAYGVVCGLLYKLLPKKPVSVYISLVVAMLCGRFVWGGVKFIMAGFSATSFSFSAFYTAAFSIALPAIIIQIVLIPILVLTFNKAKLSINN